VVVLTFLGYRQKTSGAGVLSLPSQIYPTIPHPKQKTENKKKHQNKQNERKKFKIRKSEKKLKHKNQKKKTP